MIDKTAALLFVFLAAFGPLLAWAAYAAPPSFPASAIALAVALLWLGRSGPRSRLKAGLLLVAVAAMLVANLALTEAYYLTGASFSESFFYHVRADLLFAGLAEHAGLIALALAVFAGALGCFAAATGQKRRGRSAAGPLVAVAATLALWSPLVAVSGYLGDAAAYGNADGLAARAYALLGEPAVGMPPPPVPPARAADVELPERPNLVLLYGESMERSYFDDPDFAGLTARLAAVRDRSLDFADVAAGYAADWTIAGLVASQCGYPVIDDPLINLALDRSQTAAGWPALPGAICLGDILRANGYAVVFVGGADTRFAGKREFLARHGYGEIIGTPEMADYLARHPEVDPAPALGPWGYQDSTTLRVALDRFRRLSDAGQPFALVVLTLDTHHPNGLASPGCAAGGDTMRDAIRCTADQLAGFIDSVRAGPHSADTVIAVFSDHLAHRTSQTPLLPPRPGRKMTFFVDAPGAAPDSIAAPGTVFDIPATLVDLLGGGEIALGAGTSLLRGPGFLHENRLNEIQKQYFLGKPMSEHLRGLARDALP
jgi:phosphoglycerol transferase